MRNVVILCDGMADYKIESIDNKTPMMVAKKPNMDALAKLSTQGLATTLYEDLPTGSDIANLSVLGYNPYECYTGRSPVEALGLNLPIADNDTVFRLNLVTVTTKEENFEDKSILDHSGGKISTEDAFVLLDAIKEAFSTDEISFFRGVSYRHIMMWKNIEYDFVMTPPHDILTQKIKEYLPKGKYSEKVLDMMKRSYDLLMNHPINIKRIADGLEPANCIWLWGEGTKPKLESFKEKYGKTGAIITAVPLIQGIARGTGLSVIEVEGATGDYDTNFKGKGEAAANAILDGAEFMFVHIEAPDECGHDGHLEHKIYSIEQIDKEIVSRIKEALDKTGERYRLMVIPDHATPIATRSHTLDPIPFIIYDNENPVKGLDTYDEDAAKVSGIYYANAYDIMSDFVKE